MNQIVRRKEPPTAWVVTVPPLGKLAIRARAIPREVRPEIGYVSSAAMKAYDQATTP
ncbi:MAG: hypothetical protein HUU22_01190 [Phycisphaerae bacterium]|nr:hypothetical protein [Phycisphaerae bacterium]NUQ44630.1 hypothetical protein [Phycisphaerae bacterium]